MFKKKQSVNQDSYTENWNEKLKAENRKRALW